MRAAGNPYLLNDTGHELHAAMLKPWNTVKPSSLQKVHHIVYIDEICQERPTLSFEIVEEKHLRHF